MKTIRILSNTRAHLLLLLHRVYVEENDLLSCHLPLHYPFLVLSLACQRECDHVYMYIRKHNG